MGSIIYCCVHLPLCFQIHVSHRLRISVSHFLLYDCQDSKLAQAMARSGFGSPREASSLSIIVPSNDTAPGAP